jgi:hypothetical protein
MADSTNLIRMDDLMVVLGFQWSDHFHSVANIFLREYYEARAHI